MKIGIIILAIGIIAFLTFLMIALYCCLIMSGRSDHNE